MPSISHVPRTPRPAPCVLPESPATSTAAPDEEDERADDAVARHILALHMAFYFSVVVDGVADAGHRGVNVARGDAAVRCRACGQDVARCAEFVGASVRDEPLYEFLRAGLRHCPAAYKRTPDQREISSQSRPMEPTPLHARREVAPATVPSQDLVSGATTTGGRAIASFRDRP